MSANSPTTEHEKRPGSPTMAEQAEAEAIAHLKRAIFLNGDPELVNASLNNALAAVRHVARREKEFLTIRDLENRYSLKRKAVERLEIPRCKFGGAIRFAREDVLAFEEHAKMVDTEQ